MSTIHNQVGSDVADQDADRIDLTGEVEYWRSTYESRPYADAEYFFDSDYRPAFLFGIDSRNRYSARQWDDALADHLGSEWEASRGASRLTWSQAQAAVRDAWDRTDQTFDAMAASDRRLESRFDSVDYRDPGLSFADYRSAYRYGTRARTMHPDRVWDADIEAELGRGWPLAQGTSTLTWEQARAAVHDAWNSFEQVRTNGSAGSSV
jgi:hypothetical protein